jgi:predicted ABC-type ATPase
MQVNGQSYKSKVKFTRYVDFGRLKILKSGGHDIAEPIIEQRYRMGISYLKSNVLLFSEATLFDVSTDEPRKIAQLQNGQIIYRDPHCPAWVKDSPDC